MTLDTMVISFIMDDLSRRLKKEIKKKKEESSLSKHGHFSTKHCPLFLDRLCGSGEIF